MCCYWLSIPSCACMHVCRILQKRVQMSVCIHIGRVWRHAALRSHDSSSTTSVTTLLLLLPNLGHPCFPPTLLLLRLLTTLPLPFLFLLHTGRVVLNDTAEGFEPEVALALELQVHLWVRRREPGICRHWHREGEDAATMFEDQGKRGVILHIRLCYSPLCR